MKFDTLSPMERQVFIDKAEYLINKGFVDENLFILAENMYNAQLEDEVNGIEDDKINPRTD